MISRPTIAVRTALIFIVGAALTAACGCTRGPLATKPTAPALNDPAYTLQPSLKGWYLIGNAATPGQDVMTIGLTAPPGTSYVDAWIGDLKPVRLTAQSDGSFGLQTSIADVPAGAHDVLLAADGSPSAFARVPFRRSAPYYVLVTADWDYADPGRTALGYQDALHADHAGLRMTHFVGPYTFTDPTMTAERQAKLVSWLVAQREAHADEIGLHIHPYCNFVESAGLTCITNQSTDYPDDPSGYSVKLGAYGRAKMGILLDRGNALFQQHGLTRARTFRAGGWTATLETLTALADRGFVADSSALNWARIEEWKDQQTGELYRWNKANWGPIGDTSQPYWPSRTNLLESSPPTLPVLEVPDNGVMIDYVSRTEMNALFDTNWHGQPLSAPITLMMGFHPAPEFSQSDYERVDAFIAYADRHLASQGVGPVVYITLEDVVGAFRH